MTTLIGVYFKTLFKMSAMKMLKILYNAFLMMLVLELAFEEYGRIKAVVEFFKKISVSTRIKGKIQQWNPTLTLTLILFVYAKI